MTTTIDLTASTPTVIRSADAQGRTLHLVDIENLSGGPKMPSDRHLVAWRAYARRAGVRDTDQVVVAACERVMRTLMFELPSWVSKHSAVGADGADRVLLGVGTPGWVAQRFGRVVIGSGDHAFASFGRELQVLGVHVVVVSGAGHRSRDLAGNGFGIRSIDLGRLPAQDDLGLIV